jgi:hypothetical protein
MAHPGERFSIPKNYRVERVIWNPDPQKLANGALRYVPDGDFYHPGLRTVTLLHRNQIRRGADLKVPHSVSPGRYLVVIFDGDEDGTHYTWDVLRLTQTAHVPRTGGGMRFPIIVGLGLLVCGAAFAMLHRSVHSETHRRDEMAEASAG